MTWEIIVVDDASPDGTQEIAKQLAKVYGEDKLVSGVVSVVFVLFEILMGRRCVCLGIGTAVWQARTWDSVYPWAQICNWRLCDYHGRRLFAPCELFLCAHKLLNVVALTTCARTSPNLFLSLSDYKRHTIWIL